MRIKAMFVERLVVYYTSLFCSGVMPALLAFFKVLTMGICSLYVYTTISNVHSLFFNALP